MTMRKIVEAKHTCGRQIDNRPDPTLSTRHNMSVWKRSVHKKLKRGENHGGAKQACPACKAAYAESAA